MRIALVRTASNKLKVGAYNIQELGLSKCLLERGASVDFYANFSNIESHKEILKVGNEVLNIIPLTGVKIFKEIILYRKLIPQLTNGKYDVILLEDDSQVMLPILFFLLNRRGVFTILWQGMYRNFSNPFLSILQRMYDSLMGGLIKRNAQLVLSKTPFAADYLRKKGYKEIRLLPVGLDLTFNESKTLDFYLNKRLTEFRKKHKKVLLYIGTIDKRRDVVFLINVLSKIYTKGYGLIIIGKGKGEPEVINKITQEGLVDFVFHIKEMENENLPAIYELADIFLLPTKYEIYGMVILEALFFGVPVIASKEAGPISIIREDWLGTCINLNIDDWASAIIKYSYSYRSSNLYQAKRKKYVLDNFNWEKIANDFLIEINTKKSKE